MMQRKSGRNMSTRMHLLLQRSFVDDMDRQTREKQEWWTTDVASAIREKKDAWKVIEHIKVNGNQPDGCCIYRRETQLSS